MKIRKHFSLRNAKHFKMRIRKTGKANFLGIFFICLISAVSAQNQNIQPVAVPLSDGVWVFLGNNLPKEFRYVIERKESGSNSYAKVGETMAPLSANEMVNRQSKNLAYFSKLEPLNKDEINRLWQYVNQHRAIDSFYSQNVPFVHLLAGTAFFDSTAEKNKDYTYRISKFQPNGKNSSGLESNATSEFRKPEFPKINFSSFKAGPDRITMIWAIKDQKDMSHFTIYRSVFGKENFERMKLRGETMIVGVYAEKDSLKLIMVDSIGKSPAWYEYKIAPVDAYGIEGPLQGLANGGNIADYYAPPITNFRAINTHQDHKIKLMWRLENKKYLNGVTLMRSRNYDTGYVRITTLPVEDTAYTDIVPESGENYYYFLRLESAAKTPFESARIFAFYTNDQSVPERPTEIAAETIPNGVKVYWKSEEPYANGFLVFRRRNTTEPFIQVSPVIPTGQEVYSFTDTTKTLRGGDVYQYVVRTRNEDGRFSPNSDTVSASPGIKVALTAPMNLRYRIRNNVLTIIWDNMSSWDNDLLGYNVFRKTNDSPWVKVNNQSLDPANNFINDSTIKTGNAYSYAISSFDYYGNESERSVIDIPASSKSLFPPPAGIRLSQTDNGVYITWGQIAGKLSAIKIYRSEPGKKPMLIGTVESGKDFYIDKNVAKEKLYFYQLSSVNGENKEGLLSEKVAIRLK